MDATTPQNEEGKQEATVEIYSTPSCHFCHMAKEWLTEKSISFIDHDVSLDQSKRKEMVEMTGQLGVPVIRIGNDVMVGFNKEKMAELLHVEEQA